MDVLTELAQVTPAVLTSLLRERGVLPQGAVEQLARVIRAGMFADVETRPLRYRNYELAVPIGEGTGGGDAG